jgi:hypothetical protein
MGRVGNPFARIEAGFDRTSYVGDRPCCVCAAIGQNRTAPPSPAMNPAFSFVDHLVGAGK